MTINIQHPNHFFPAPMKLKPHSHSTPFNLLVQKEQDTRLLADRINLKSSGTRDISFLVLSPESFFELSIVLAFTSHTFTKSLGLHSLSLFFKLRMCRLIVVT